MKAELIEKCKKAVFIDIGKEWVRVDYFNEEEGYVYAYNEVTGDEYLLDKDDLAVARGFYELKKIHP